MLGIDKLAQGPGTMTGPFLFPESEGNDARTNASGSEPVGT